MTKSQHWPLPFSYEEFLAAYRRVMPEKEARELVDAMADGFAKPRRGNIEGYQLPLDTLDLLAAVSDDLSKRVRVYREEQSRAIARAADRRAELLRRLRNPEKT